MLKLILALGEDNAGALLGVLRCNAGLQRLVLACNALRVFPEVQG